MVEYLDKPRKVLTLKEYKPVLLAQEAISYSAGEMIWQNYSSQVDVSTPSFKTDNQWKLVSLGWVGFIPLPDNFFLVLQPKVSLSNLFRMLEYAYKLGSFKFLKGLVDCDSVEDYYSRLAAIFSRMVLERGRRGLYREYSLRDENLPFVRGRMDVARNLPWKINIYCHYEEHTPDIEDNQIISWTLNSIVRSGLCRDDVMPGVRKAFREMQEVTSFVPFCSQDCSSRIYNRLNSDYHPLHAFCHLFLDHSGPSYDIGGKKIIPFLVNMGRLFELFLKEWLIINLPETIDLRYQERIYFGNKDDIHFFIADICLYDRHSGQVLCVIDAKYSVPDTPSPDSIAQVVANSKALGCKNAVLVYPEKLSRPLDASIGEIRIRSLIFDLSVDLDEAGKQFIQSLFE